MQKFFKFWCGAFPFLNESESSFIVVMYRAVMFAAHICLFSLLVFLGWLGIRMMAANEHNIFQELLGWMKPHILGISQMAAIGLILGAFLCGLSAYNWREKAPWGYGFTEALVGAEAIAIAFITFSVADIEKADSAGVALMFSLIGGVYIIVRGLDNMMKARKQRDGADQKKKDEAELIFLNRIERSAAIAAEAAYNSATASKEFAEAARLGIASRLKH